MMRFSFVSSGSICSLLLLLLLFFYSFLLVLSQYNSIYSMSLIASRLTDNNVWWNVVTLNRLLFDRFLFFFLFHSLPTVLYLFIYFIFSTPIIYNTDWMCYVLCFGRFYFILFHLKIGMKSFDFSLSFS